jgi:hypothetical protein
MRRGRPKKQYGYLRAAAHSFLEGTRCRTPEEAVLKGVRTLEGWADALRAAKEAQVAARIQPRTPVVPDSSQVIPSSGTQVGNA